MALPSSGTISLNAINTELGKSPTSQISLNDSDVRGLLVKASGQISLADAYGKSKAVASGGNIVVGYHSVPTPDQFTTFDSYGYSSGQDSSYYPSIFGSANPSPLPVKAGVTCAVLTNFYDGFQGNNVSLISVSGYLGSSMILRDVTHGINMVMNYDSSSGGYYRYIGGLFSSLDIEGATIQFAFLNSSGGAL